MGKSTLHKIAVAMSGGVDSSIAALLLKEEGLDVIGVNLNLWSCFKAPSQQSCCSPKDREDARCVCETLGIPFVSVDMREGFKDLIVKPFVSEYFNGRTPNPCIGCNTLIKFGLMLDWVRANLGATLLATGHYARLMEDGSGIHLLKGADSWKDQSYFLFDIRPSVLPFIRFPVGAYTKDRIRILAERSMLPVAVKDESQEVCFIPDGDIRGFIDDYYPEYGRPKGNFVDGNGRVLGRHNGVHAYTIGQRRGLGIGFGSRTYVTGINADKNEVVLGTDKELFKTRCRVERLNLFEDVGIEFRADVKIRYKTNAVSARIKIGGGGADVEFEGPVRAITPGQAAVFYDGEKVLGGGWIM